MNDSVTVTASIDDVNSDNAWDPLADQSVAVTVTDDDSPGITVSTTALSVPEAASASAAVVLDAQPSGNVTLTVTSSNPSLVTATPSTLTFTPGQLEHPPVGRSERPRRRQRVTESATITLAVDVANTDNAWDGLATSTSPPPPSTMTCRA